jgi:hypothetical protein
LGSVETADGNGQLGPAPSGSRGVLIRIAALALAPVMLALLASCGGGDRTGSVKQQPASRSPTYVKPHVYAVGGAERSHATGRSLRRSSAAPLTRSFPLGTQTICCQTPRPGVR